MKNIRTSAEPNSQISRKKKHCKSNDPTLSITVPDHLVKALIAEAIADIHPPSSVSGNIRNQKHIKQERIIKRSRTLTGNGLIVLHC